MSADLCKTCHVPLGDTYGRTPEGRCTAHGASGVDNGWVEVPWVRLELSPAEQEFVDAIAAAPQGLQAFRVPAEMLNPSRVETCGRCNGSGHHSHEDDCQTPCSLYGEACERCGGAGKVAAEDADTETDVAEARRLMGVER